MHVIVVIGAALVGAAFVSAGCFFGLAYLGPSQDELDRWGPL
jgi:hypothetical protein